jgi:ornithine--oxo-acid transaminase
MALNIESLLSEAQGQNYELHNEHINPAFTKVLRTIGFDRNYVRAEGQYLWDDKGNKYLDMLICWLVTVCLILDVTTQQLKKH